MLVVMQQVRLRFLMIILRHSFLNYQYRFHCIEVGEGGLLRSVIIFNFRLKEKHSKKPKEQISLEIRQSIFNLNESAENIELSQTSMNQADENLRLLQNQFEAGIATGSDVLEAQILKQRAYADFINAKAQHKINQSIYLRAIGSNLDK